MKYLVTGAAGNLARQIVERLLESGHEVLALDLPESAPVECRYEQADITNHQRIDSIFRGFKPQRVIHMASLLSGSSEANPKLAWEVNATASYRMLELCVELGVERFFYPSTAATYGENLPDPLPEDYPQWPVTIYGATKVAVERTGVWFSLKRNLDFRSVRLPMVLSPYAPAAAVTAYASHSFAAAVRGEKFVFPVKPATGISTIYVKDVVTGILQITDADPSVLTQRVYNLHGFGPTAGDIAAAITSILPAFEHAFEPTE
ncbi:MAG: NAD-dependent epimerase/dehydratase family protein, partial [Spirochaetales bacterium]